jgi:hypothetical protein
LGAYLKSNLVIDSYGIETPALGILLHLTIVVRDKFLNKGGF